MTRKSSPKCINLRQRFGDQYRITHDECYALERPEFRAEEEIWLQQIPCDKGHICPWGGDLLAACTNTRGPTAAKLMKLPFVDRNRSQDGDDGVNAVFPVEYFDIVAAIMRPKRRRRCHLSPEQRQINAERMREINRERWEHRSNARQNELERTQTGRLDIGAAQTL